MNGFNGNEQELYRSLCSDNPEVPLFHQPWWLDAVAGYGGWDVSVVKQDDRIVASWPYVLRTRFGFTFIEQPTLTQTLGPWLWGRCFPDDKESPENIILIEALLKEFPKFDHFAQSLHSTCDNWLPFYWHGFNQTTRYSYRLNDIKSTDHIWSGLKASVRRDITKAKKRSMMSVRFTDDVQTLIEFNRHTFERQNISPPHSEKFLSHVLGTAIERGQGIVAICENSNGVPESAVFVAWDSWQAYYILGGRNPLNPNSGAGTLCLWECIQYVGEYTNCFDFEGSMIRSIEKYFRSFGATRTSFSYVYKTQSRIIRLAKAYNA